MTKLSEHQKNILFLAASDGGSSGYPGVQFDLAPKVARRFLREGLAYEWTPHNPAHKERIIATDEGRALLSQIEGGES